MWQQLWRALALLALILIYARGTTGRRNELELADIRVYTNRIVPYGKATYVVLTIFKFPVYPIRLRLSTASYLLAYFEVSVALQEMPPPFRRSTNIGQILSDLEIYPSYPVAYEVGYYAKVEAIFWDIYDTKIKLTGSVPTKPTFPPANVEVDIEVSPPTETEPVLTMMRCTDPHNPQKVVLLRSTTLRAFFVKRRSIRNLNLTWHILNLDESEIFASITDQGLIITLKRYSLSYPTTYELWRNLYVLRPEGTYEGNKFAARCYVEAVMGGVEAIITGGPVRDAIRGKALLMDGSLSRDHSKSTLVQQFTKFKWDCQSHEDYRNPLCHKDMDAGSKLLLPANSLRLDSQYEFTLTLVSDQNPKLMSTAKQVVSIVKHAVFHVAIVCLTNCAYDQYNPANKVQLVAKCMDCAKQTITYAWYVGGQYTLSSKYLTMEIRTQGTIARITLIIRSKDGCAGRQVKLLMKRVSPVGGWCGVTPKVGIEATTPFYVCCRDFVTAHKPIEYFYYAKRLLLNRCYDCECESYLPRNISSIKVLICDNLLTCRMTFVDVTVKPLENVVIEPPEALSEFINTKPNNLVKMANHGLIPRFFQVTDALANRINHADSGYVLMRPFDSFHPHSLTALGQMANLTLTIGGRLNPIDTYELRLLTKSLVKVNEIFEVVLNYQIHKEMVEQPFINLTVALMSVHKMMQHLSDKAPRPPQSIFDQYRNARNTSKLNQALVDKLAKEISDYDDENAKLRSMTWLNSTWQTDRLYRFLGLARKHGLEADSDEVSSQAVSLEIQCFQIIAGRQYKIETSDSMHIVYFSPDLLEEVKASYTNNICLKVLSTIRELNWWYPDEKQPSSIILSVRIYILEDNFKVERRLYHSKISFRTIVGKYQPAIERPNVTSLVRSSEIPENLNGSAIPNQGTIMSNYSKAARASDYYDDDDDLIFKDRGEKLKTEGARPTLDDDEDEYAISDSGRYINCLENGSLPYMQWIRLYRINVEGNAMITVRFKTSTHALQVLLYIGNTPKEWKVLVNNAKCFVPANSNNKTMLILNTCKNQKRAYMAVQLNGSANYAEDTDTPVPGGPALFSFVFQERSCDYWTYSLSEEDQHWSHDYCTPVLEYQKKGTLHCTCAVLGTYTSYLYHIKPIVIPLELAHVHLNRGLLLTYILIFSAIIVWLLVLVIWYNDRPSKTVLCDMSGMESESSRDMRELVIFLKTGGRINSETTASVRLIFQTTQRAELQFTVMQDPQNPQLTRNSTYVLLVRTRDIRIPTRVAVAHNNFGRYPSWYLRRIEILDVQKQLTQIFIVNRWVRKKFLILSSSMVLKVGDYRMVENWRERFYSEYERLWINWGLWHPLTGKWRDSKNYDSLSRAQRTCVFVSKMMVTYCIIACVVGQSTRHSAYEDRKITININDLIFMFTYCAIATNLIHFLFVNVILRGV